MWSVWRRTINVPRFRGGILPWKRPEEQHGGLTHRRDSGTRSLCRGVAGYSRLEDPAAQLAMVIDGGRRIPIIYAQIAKICGSAVFLRLLSDRFVGAIPRFIVCAAPPPDFVPVAPNPMAQYGIETLFRTSPIRDNLPADT